MTEIGWVPLEGFESKANVSHKTSLLLHRSLKYLLRVLENTSLLLVRLFILRTEDGALVSKGSY